MSYFSNKLIQLRKNASMTQSDLSERLGISRSAVSMYESALREPDFEMLENIADCFNISMGDLVDPSIGDVKISNKQQALLDLIPQLSDAQVDAILALAKSIVSQ